MSLDRAAWRFFHEHAGYATPPGAAVCAAQLARAAAEAKANGIRFTWAQDDSADDSWMSETERAQSHEWEYCVARDAEGNVLASLCGICDADANYRRVVEAELAAEALSELSVRSVCP